MPLGRTELCKIKLWRTNMTQRFAVVDLPESWDSEFDGIIGWKSTPGELIHLDARTKAIRFLERLPTQVDTWTKVPIITNTDILYLNLSASNKTEIMEVSTGDPEGVALIPTDGAIGKQLIRSNR